MTNHYHELLSLQAEVYKSFANPKRLEIISCLRNYELTVSELQTMLGWRQANISQHLALLRQLRLVKARRNGVNIYYSLADNKIIKAYDLVRELMFKNSPDSSYPQNDLFQISKDPVCGMHVNALTASESYLHMAKTYYFCGRGCLKQFIKMPTRFV